MSYKGICIFFFYFLLFKIYRKYKTIAFFEYFYIKNKKVDERVFNIIGTDPGSHLGVSILTIDTTTLKILSVNSITITLDRYIENDDMIDRLNFLTNTINGLYKVYIPVAVAMEVSFMNMKYPNAVMILTQYVSAIERAWYSCNPYIKIYKYAPMYIKSVLSGTGKADKDDMRVAISKNKELKKLVNLKTMTEHEVDATGIAYTALLEIRKFQYYLWTIS